MSEIEDTIRRLIREELAKARSDERPRVELVTAAEYARARSISESTVRKAIRSGRLHAHRIGKAVRVSMYEEIKPPQRDEDSIRARRRARILRRAA